jgi:ectoine hydroxylase-related dioxygenase (phytanoyl-CoA dioxygenase family)
MRSVTSEERTTFAADGVVCLRAALDPDVVAAMAEPVEVALRSRVTADLSALVGTRDAGATGGRFAGGIDHWREQPEFAAFACTGALPRLVAELLGATTLWLYEDSVLVKEPGAVARTVWHQDLGYFHVSGDQLATTWCPLDVVTPDSGAVRYARGSHRWEATFRPNLFVTDDPIPDTVGDLVPDVDALAGAGECELLTFTTEPGDVVVHHARTLHAAGGNSSPDRRRRVVSVRYVGEDARTLVRPGAPRKAHQLTWTDGRPFSTLDPADHPRVWPVDQG